MATEFLLRVLGIIAIDVMLAGDNAVIIALAVRNLPDRQQFLGRIWGTAGAVVLRIGLIFGVTMFLGLPFLKLVGGLVLIWIAVKLVRTPSSPDLRTREAGTLHEAIWVIIVADAAMSLDNILGVAAAAHGDMLLVVLGIGISLPIVVWGSGVVSRLMSRYVWIVWMGGAILGFVAGEMIVSDPLIAARIGAVRPAIPLTLAAAVGVVGMRAGWREPAESRRVRRSSEARDAIRRT